MTQAYAPRILGCLIAMLATGAGAFAQVQDMGDGSFTVVPYGGSNQFLDPERFGIYCASSHLLETADPAQGYPPWRALAEYRSTMEAWRENDHVPPGRTAADFVIYLNAGTPFHVLGVAAHNDQQNPHYKIRVDGGPQTGRTCWTNYE
jgi:hypothetical protein